MNGISSKIIFPLCITLLVVGSILSISLPFFKIVPFTVGFYLFISLFFFGCVLILYLLYLIISKMRDYHQHTELLITELKRDRRRAYDIINNLNSGVIVCSLTEDQLEKGFVVVDINNTVADTNKVEREKVVSRRLEDVFPNIGSSGLIDALFKLNKTGTPQELELSYTENGHNVGWRRNYLYKLESEEFVIIYHDVTALRSVEAEKDKMREQLIQSAKLASIGELAAGIGHEINNPLAIIKGYIDVLEEMLKDTDVDEDLYKGLLEAQCNSVARIRDIVDGIKNYSRSSNDQVEVIDVRQTIEELLGFLKVIYEKSGMKIITEFSKSDLLISCNKGKLQQVFVNLISNAKDATDKMDSAKLAIMASVIEDKVVIRFADNGVGIKPNGLQYIFESFYTTKGEGKGTGLGLSISKNIIEKMNGTLEVESKENEGCSFTISIPHVT